MVALRILLAFPAAYLRDLWEISRKQAMTVNDLRIGQQAIVKEFMDIGLGHQLLEMGVIPGETITVERIAPMGDPIAVRVSEVLLMMRRQEAATILVKGEDD